jgi:aspartate-semialdehyde dehydrogenase
MNETNRVAVLEGHTESIFLKLEKKASLDEIRDCLSSFSPSILSSLPSSPSNPIFVFDEQVLDRPQPRLDRYLGNGYIVSVGRIRQCPIWDVKLTLLSHNTIVGAAGGAILNAELAYAKKLIV